MCIINGYDNNIRHIIKVWYFKIYYSRKLQDGPDLTSNKASSGETNGVSTITSLDKTFSKVDIKSTQNNQIHRTVVPNHVIPSDVPAEKHPNASYANNFIRYISCQ